MDTLKIILYYHGMFWQLKTDFFEDIKESTATVLSEVRTKRQNLIIV